MAPGPCRVLRREHVLVVYMPKLKAKDMPFFMSHGVPRTMSLRHLSRIEAMEVPDIPGTYLKIISPSPRGRGLGGGGRNQY